MRRGAGAEGSVIVGRFRTWSISMKPPNILYVRALGRTKSPLNVRTWSDAAADASDRSV